MGDLLELGALYNRMYLIELVSTGKWAARQDISTTLREDLTCKGKTCAMMLICSPPPSSSEHHQGDADRLQNKAQWRSINK